MDDIVIEIKKKCLDWRDDLREKEWMNFRR